MSKKFKITGTLTSLTPFHIGSGDQPVQRKNLTKTVILNGVKEKVKVDITPVVVDTEDKPYLPGTTLKGNIRSWLRKIHSDPAVWKIIEELFGTENSDDDNAKGGKLEFHNAFFLGTDISPENIPYWDPIRLTGVMTSVAIDPVTRTALDAKLYHEEFVPDGVSFSVEITGTNVSAEEQAFLACILEQGFNESSEEPITLGASTGNTYGRFSWEQKEILEITEQDVLQWLDQGEIPAGYTGLKAFSVERTSEIESLKTQFVTARTSAKLLIDVELAFESFFMVNDPSKVPEKKKNEDEEEKRDPNSFDAFPLLNKKNQVVLPAKSVRGAFRGQAEKILRTLNTEAVCTERKPCEGIFDVDKKDSLCLACQVFGAGGWKAPVSFTEFAPSDSDESKIKNQEFVAIDRFTGAGGGSSGAKFNIKTGASINLTGTITIDLDRIEKWMAGLLAYTLRDLMEGDISFGYGTWKGYGSCHAKINRIFVSGLSDGNNYANALKECELDIDDINNMDLNKKIPDEINLCVMDFVEAFKQTVQVYHRKPVGTEVA